MTRGIEDMLNIPHMDEIMKTADVDFEAEDTNPYETETVDINQTAQLPIVDDGDHAKSMDVIYKETLDHSRTLMDLAFNTDERSRRGILEIATSMYKNAIDAKNSKREMQLKIMQIMQNQQKIDLDNKKFKAEMGENAFDTESTIIEDRNELIKRIREQAKENK